MNIKFSSIKEILKIPILCIFKPGLLQVAQPLLEEEKKAIATDIAAVYDEAAGTGLDKKVIRKLISWRKKTEEERSEEDQLFQIYLEAIESLCNAAPANNVVKIA